MTEKEFDLIHFALKSRLNKEVKIIKKLYQAKIDGDGAINFHSKCDNIPNTLTLIKSVGKRRFGGFTSQIWESDKSGKWKDDKYSSLFSLDKQKYIFIKMMGKQFIAIVIMGLLLEMAMIFIFEIMQFKKKN